MTRLGESLTLQPCLFTEADYRFSDVDVLAESVLSPEDGALAVSNVGAREAPAGVLPDVVVDGVGKPGPSSAPPVPLRFRGCNWALHFSLAFTAASLRGLLLSASLGYMRGI